MMPERERALEADRQTVRLEVPALPGYVVLARLALSAVCRLTPLAPEDVADLKLAITEAATAFVGDTDEATPPLAPASGPDDEHTLRFAFELADDELRMEVDCDCDVDLTDDEGELARAIIAATVDRWDSSRGSIRLAKRLRPSGG
jgi:hypothetical protein